MFIINCSYNNNNSFLLRKKCIYNMEILIEWVVSKIGIFGVGGEEGV